MAELQPVFYDSPIGPLRLTVQWDQLVGIDFVKSLPCSNRQYQSQIIQQLNLYFSSPCSLIHLAGHLTGTAFQQRVWQALKQIPLGQTVTYGLLANKLNTSARAIGMACRTNPLPIVIPCHRVTAQSGIGGFGGATHGRNITRKRWLLVHEQNSC